MHSGISTSISSKRRRILVIHCAYKQQGGEDAVVAEEMKLLQATGNIVSLLQFSNEQDSLLTLIQLPFNLSSYIKTSKKIKAFKPDVVHIHNLHFAASASVIYAVKKQGVPIVMTLHNFRLLCPSATLFFNNKIFTNSLKEEFCWTAVKKGVYQNSRLLTLWLAFSMWLHQKMGTLHRIDKFILLSSHSAKLFEQSKLKLRKSQLAIKPNFVSIPPDFSSEKQHHFLFAGRLTEEKGVSLLLNTFAQNGYQIKIAGDGPLKETVLEYCGRFNNIQYLGSLNKQHLFRELSSCTALVFPSTWYEGMPLTIIEAFACGTPVIATDLGAMTTMINHQYNGLHFNLNQFGNLDFQLNYWINLNAAEKNLYSSNAAETYHRLYTPATNSAQLLSIYDAVIAHKHKQPQAENIYLN